jgi:hypothetical protein
MTVLAGARLMTVLAGARLMTMDDRQRLLVEMNGGQRALLLAMADLEEEQGNSQCAAGWRWLAKNDRWPVRLFYLNSISWQWEEEKRNPPCSYSHSLPALLLEIMYKRVRVQKGLLFKFRSPERALECAAICAGQLIAVGLLEKP